ncbi:hypothetical protein H9643_01020 [Ochrobactrum sp. Sa2BUA5]|uniref:GIY-YIG domain-containing protein n=1 Tax=Ochrobactrum quorumnocens TaxID=271865 RepID=A0A5N1K691_9HYPH|nr:hypothetical protein [[Ochrobactrum] quorumnocens]KAA9370171.1 hypothetical protein F3W84_04690 [[Ochrobactrum] quorumnocens]MBD7989360.1 hypothetical protein [Ochrobactrum gallinarum]
MIDRFSDAVKNELQAYVYRLIDPRDGKTFYVGKGRGDRVFQHVKEVESISTDQNSIMNPKLETIAEIKRAGFEVKYLIHRHGMNDDTAYQVEAALIDAYEYLHNSVRGHYTSINGLSTVDEILHRYNLPEASFSHGHNLLVITINKLRGRRDPKVIFDLVRYCWKLRIERAASVEYVLAADRGVIVGAFKPLRWTPAVAKDFPDIVGMKDEPHRLAFQGERAPQEIWDIYVAEHGKRINPMDIPPARQACRYISPA